MSNRTYLDPSVVPTHLRGGYKGKKFKAVVTDKVTVPATAGLWDGGSRDTWHAVRIEDGAQVPFPGQQAAPWDNQRQGIDVPLRGGFCVICHTTFRGKDLGLTFYLAAADAAPLLPAPVGLSAHERIVLTATRKLKSSYGGRDRYQMAVLDRGHLTTRIDGERQMTRAEWDAAKARLIERGLLTKTGAITVTGRNALEGDEQ